MSDLRTMAKRDFYIGRLGLVVLAAAGMTACVSRAGLESSTAPADPTSRIGQAMIEATRNPGPYPKFSDIPKVPATAAPALIWEELAGPVEAERTTLDAHVAALPTVSAPLTEQDAQRLRTAGAIQPPSADSVAQTEAFARSLRSRAKPPPAPR